MPFAVGGTRFDEARQAGLLFDGDIGVLRPAPRSGKERGSRRRSLPVGNLRGVERIAYVVDPGAGAPRAAGGPRRIVRTIHGASLRGIVEQSAVGFPRLGPEFRAVGGIVHL